MFIKPVIRWIIGSCSDSGFDLLKMSILKFKKIYLDKFYYVICYNNLSKNQFSKLPLHLCDEIIDQKHYCESLSYTPPNCNHLGGPAWKLYPPRMYFDRHEIIIDNDIVIYKNLPEIDLFLNSNNIFLTTEAYARNYAGKFINLIKPDFKINSGLVGLPPLFDYGMKIQQLLNSVSCNEQKRWETHFEEQAIVATILQNQNTLIIPLHKIQVTGKVMGYKLGLFGTHFVGVNQGFDLYWKNFRSYDLL